MSNRQNKLDYESLVKMQDLFEAITDFITDRNLNFNVTMHALTRAVAYGGMQMRIGEETPKHHFINMVVEAVSTHYDDLADSYDTAQKMEKGND